MKKETKVVQQSMFGVKKGDLYSAQYLEMKAFNEAYEDMPDGAFFAMAEEMNGWDAEDWGWFSEVQELDTDYK